MFSLLALLGVFGITSKVSAATGTINSINHNVYLDASSDYEIVITVNFTVDSAEWYYLRLYRDDGITQIGYINFYTASTVNSKNIDTDDYASNITAIQRKYKIGLFDDYGNLLSERWICCGQCSCAGEACSGGCISDCGCDEGTPASPSCDPNCSSISTTTTTTTVPSTTTTTTIPGTTTTTIPGTTTTTIHNVLNKAAADILTDLIDWLLNLVGAIAIFMFIIGGILYLTAAGRENQLEIARKTLIYAVLGLLLCGISYAIIKTAVKILAE